jgi:putative Mg2+ transporter-C (MgtC) family protein
VGSIFVSTSVPEWQIFVRLLAAVVLGSALGFEREAKNRPAGLKTHMLTALAAAVVAVVTIELGVLASKAGYGSDPVRAIEAITTGVAFLAAGTIIQARGRVIGLTTGAGIWLAGAIGLTCGFGYLSIAVMATVFAVIILAGLQKLTDRVNPDTENTKRSSNG